MSALPSQPVAGGLVGLVVPMAVVLPVVTGVGTALTGRIGRHSTPGLAVVSAARLVVTELDQGVGRGHPQLGGERRVVRYPV
jgi:hypothetical protein